jgi:hypothetical protein
MLLEADAREGSSRPSLNLQQPMASESIEAGDEAACACSSVDG